MNKSPKLSVIIPCYNNGEYLSLMLDCFLRQTVNNWEVIVVDDGSTDNTPSIVEAYVSKDYRIQFYYRNRELKGSTVCRNIGFEKSCGKYVCHLDADDLVSDTFVEHRVRFMEEHPELDYASFCAKTFVDGSSILPTFKSKTGTFGVKVQTHDLLEDFLSAQYSFSVWNNIYRRDSIKDIEWDEKVKIYTDFSYILPGILKGLKHSFSDIPDVDYFYRIFPNKSNSINMCSNFVSDEKCQSTLYLFQNVIDWLSMRSDSKLRKNQFLRFIILNFERLMKGHDLNQINQYIQFIKKNYPSKVANKFELIKDTCVNIPFSRMYEFKLYWLLVLKFNSKRFRTPFIHSFVKMIIGK